MLRVGVRDHWLVTALLCVVMLGSIVLAGVWWCGASRVSLLQQGTAAYNHLDWQAAEICAREQIKAQRDDLEAQRLLARSLFRQGRDQPAMTIHMRLADNMMTAEDYFLRGQALVRVGQKERGILFWRQALGRDLNHVETLVALEHIFFRLDLLGEAARAAERLSSQGSWAARANLMLGSIRTAQSDPAGAAQALQSALSHPDQWHGMDDPNQVRKRLARALLQTARPAQARDELQRMSQTIDDPETCWLLSRCDLQQGKDTDTAVMALARSYRQSHPMEPEPAPFVGEARCAQCHEDISQPQYHSRHARTFLRKGQFFSLPLPERPIADPGNPQVIHSFNKRDQRAEVRTQFNDQVYQTIIDYAFGSGDRGLTLVGHDQEKRFFEYRLSYYPDPGGWDLTVGQPVRAAQPSYYQGMRTTPDAVRRCLVCHTTDSHAILTGSGAASADRAIGCERCHGPGSHHLKAIASKQDYLAIARPTLATGPQIVSLCSQCHSPRDQNINLSPGSPESVRFQGSTFTWSRCYVESGSKLHCVTCHDPHRNAEAMAAWYEAMCLDCHSATRSLASRSIQRPEHAKYDARTSCPVQPAHNCINCHMPKVDTPMAHARFTDHFIRVHRDSDSLSVTPAR